MKHLPIIALCVIALATTALAQDAAPKPEKAAEINGAVITKTDLETEVGRVVDRLAMQGRPVPPDQMKALRRDVLDNMINRELLYQESQTAGVKVTDAEVDEKLADIKKNFPDEAQFQKTMADMNTTEADIRTTIRRSLAVQKWIDTQVAEGVTVTDADAKTFYDGNPDQFTTPEQVKASHILIKSDPMGPEEDKAKARDKIRDIQEKVKKGDDFAQLAKDHSEGPSNKSGGDLGYFSKGQMVKPFEEAAFALNPGEVSDIVVTQFGYHLIKVFDKKPAGAVSFDEAKGDITDYLKRQKTMERVQAQIETLRKTAKIETFM